MRKIVFLTVFVVSLAVLYAQSNNPASPIITIGDGDSAMHINQVMLSHYDSLHVTPPNYYKVNAIVSVKRVTLIDGFKITDIQIDTLLYDEPEGWTREASVNQLTVCEWSDSSVLSDTSSMCNVSLKSIYPTNYVGHGECYIVYRDMVSGHSIQVPYDIIGKGHNDNTHIYPIMQIDNDK